MGKIIMCGSFKGGVGKSVTTFNLAYSLAEIGKKVLCVDFDSQATGICIPPMFRGTRPVSFSTSTDTAILITSTVVETASDRLSEAYRAMIGGR